VRLASTLAGSTQWIDVVTNDRIVPGDGGQVSVTVDAADKIGVCGRQHREAVGAVGEFCDEWVKRNGSWHS
jgi:hypothetical protein